jgi:hypothetical protein
MTMPGRICVALRLLIFVRYLQFDFVDSNNLSLSEAACLERPAYGGHEARRTEKRVPREQTV